MQPRLATPFGLAAGRFAFSLLMLIRYGLHLDAQIFVYPLDDASIHLAVGRIGMEHGLHSLFVITHKHFLWSMSRNGWRGSTPNPPS